MDLKIGYLNQFFCLDNYLLKRMGGKLSLTTCAISFSFKVTFENWEKEEKTNPNLS